MTNGCVYVHLSHPLYPILPEVEAEFNLVMYDRTLQTLLSFTPSSCCADMAAGAGGV